jgi:ankyrin repeat protein
MPTWDLHACARFNRVEELLDLIRAGAQLDQKDEFGTTALHYAITYKNTDVINLLLAHGANVAVQDNDGSTPLHYACEHKLYEVAAALLKKDPGLVSRSDKHGNQPLWTAVFNTRGDFDTVTLLLSYGADPEHQNNAQMSPLEMARRKGDESLVQILESPGSALREIG